MIGFRGIDTQCSIWSGYRNSGRFPFWDCISENVGAQTVRGLVQLASVLTSGGRVLCRSHAHEVNGYSIRAKENTLASVRNRSQGVLLW